MDTATKQILFLIFILLSVCLLWTQTADAMGQFCIKKCAGKACGDDGCGGSCGECGPEETCEENMCVSACVPDCEGKNCGDDGCDGSCGECGTGETCEQSMCVACVPDCTSKDCGDDGCGGSCGTCVQDEVCSENTCVGCVPECFSKDCGDDGCGGSCGLCQDNEVCSDYVCTCVPDCTAQDCGEDGCGGSCGTCGANEVCLNDMTCVYSPAIEDSFTKTNITNLRTSLNNKRVQCGISYYNFTDPTLVAGSTPIRAVHITELRDAINDVYGLAPQRLEYKFEDATITPNQTPVRETHYTELVDAYENITCCGDGICNSTYENSSNCPKDCGAAASKGMTWRKSRHDNELNIDVVGCGGSCNAYRGDTDCSEARPVLCLKVDNSPRPNYDVPENSPGGMAVEAYHGWAKGTIQLTEPILGTALTSLTTANTICRSRFGSGYRMAEFHDGYWISGMDKNVYYDDTWPSSGLKTGGWNFYAHGNVSNASRFWVYIDDQRANCWNNR